MNKSVFTSNLPIHLMGVEVGTVEVRIAEKVKLQYPLHGYNDSLLLGTAEFNKKQYKIASIEGGVDQILSEIKSKIERDLTFRKSRKNIYKTIEKLTGAECCN